MIRSVMRGYKGDSGSFSAGNEGSQGGRGCNEGGGGLEREWVLIRRGKVLMGASGRLKEKVCRRERAGCSKGDSGSGFGG